METLKILRTNDELLELVEYLKDKDLVAFDSETSGIDEDAEIIGYSICAEETVAYYVITQEWNGNALITLETFQASNVIMEILKSKQLIMHNGLFDCKMVLQNYHVDLTPSLYADTMILAHLTDENRRVGLKELGAFYFGDSAKAEQAEMKASVTRNGGELTKANYELYKADSGLIAKYGAKDAILTYNLFYILMQDLLDQGMDKFFFDDECMPLLRGPTAQMNHTGLRVDMTKLQDLKKSLEAEILELKAYIYNEIEPHIKDKYPGTGKTNVFNIGAGGQIAWLLFDKLGNTFPKLSDSGQELCRSMEMRVPYDNAQKRTFVTIVKERKGMEWKPKSKIRDYWAYLSTDKVVMGQFAKKYKWVAKLIEYNKAKKMLNTYVLGIEAGTRYGIIRPQFLQHGTTSGRYSSKKPNFQNLPRDDKRVKACIVSRPGYVFVGADQSQLEPRVFASISQDKPLMDCFESGEDFYSVVGAPIFDKYDCSLVKDAPNSFAKQFPHLRDKAKVIALATPYGRTARQQASAMGIEVQESQELINRYFTAYPKVEQMMLTFHKDAKTKGYVESIFGRKRRIPEAMKIPRMYGNMSHGELPYAARNLLNLAVNHPIQSTGASIMNRSAIRLYNVIQELSKSDSNWNNVKIVIQIHDSLAIEGPEELADDMVVILRECLENTTVLPGVKLIADPQVGKSLADLK